MKDVNYDHAKTVAEAATMHPNGSRTTRDSQAALRSTCNLDNPFFLSTRNSFYPETGHQLSACGRKEETEMNAQNVLLVDDQPLIRKSLRSILSRSMKT